jgi:hypothetical protein
MDSAEDARAIAAEFPAWEAWQGIDRLWHARIRGATPPVMVHGEDPVDLRDQIIRYQGRHPSDLWGGTASDPAGRTPDGAG